MAAAAGLVEDDALRIEQMLNNYRYYHAWLRPDSLVLNTLAVALSGGTAPAANPGRSPRRQYDRRVDTYSRVSPTRRGK